MVSFAPLSEETLEDRRRYLDDHLAQVACLDCLATVGVRKHSEHQTSIQWSAESVAACAEFSRARAERRVGLPEGCGRMRASIARAVAEGQLPIGEGVD
jgi:hypothetical protein